MIGYENRVLATQDFKDDRKDAGEMGAGHTVTALYELLSPEQAARMLDVDAPKYTSTTLDGSRTDELATVKLRYKAPQGNTSRLIELPIGAKSVPLNETSDAFRFSAAVASFGMLLRQSEYRGQSSFDLVTNLARGALGRDRSGYRAEFLGLVAQARSLEP